MRWGVFVRRIVQGGLVGLRARKGGIRGVLKGR